MPRTVKVRIAAAIDREGIWSASGHALDHEATWADYDYILEGLEPGERRYWITAELERPEESEVREVEGEVSDA